MNAISINLPNNRIFVINIVINTEVIQYSLLYSLVIVSARKKNLSRICNMLIEGLPQLDEAAAQFLFARSLTGPERVNARSGIRMGVLSAHFHLEGNLNASKNTIY